MTNEWHPLLGSRSIDPPGKIVGVEIRSGVAVKLDIKLGKLDVNGSRYIRKVI